MSQRKKRPISDEEEDEHEARAKKPARRRKKADEDEDHEEGKESTNKAKRWESLSREERDKLVGDVMRLALFLDHKKHPLKRADITTKVLAGYKGSNISSQLIAEAQEKFKSIFGYELVEVPRVRTDAAADSGKAGTGVYILKNVFPKETKAVIASGTNNEGLTNQTALLHTILALITLSEGVLESEVLFTGLRKLGLTEDRPDPVLGDWKKLIDYFVKELYIHRQKVTGRVSTSGAAISEYRWGGRALLEIDKIEIMRHVAAMFGEQLDPLIVQEMEKAQQQRKQKSTNERSEASAVTSKNSQTTSTATRQQAGGRGRPSRQDD